MARRLQYSEEVMEMAVDAVKSGTMNPFKAHKVFNVPRTTIIDKVAGRTPVRRQIGVSTVLSKQEEDLLLKWIFHMATCGFPVTKMQLLDSVELLMKQLNKKHCFKNGRPGRHWYEGFMRRHPELSARIAQNLTSGRASVNEVKIRRWFEEILQYLESNGAAEITNDPTRVFNCDETALYLNPKDDKVLVRKGDKVVYSFINNDEKECLTTLITCNANGQLAPPMIMFTYKRIPKGVVDKIPLTWGVGRSDSGWMTGESFFEYVANVFQPWLVENKISLPVILFLDGHKSHLTMELSNFCSSHGIILICLLPNSTHILQPLDVAVFRPLKMEYRKVIRQWRITNNGAKINREDFAPIVKNTLEAMNKLNEIIKKGFRTCGLVPMNADAINYAKYFKNEPQLNSTEVSIQPDPAEVTNPKQFLNFLEKEISNKIQSFISSGEEWFGPIEDQSLFTLWYSLKSRCHITAENDVNGTDFPFEDDTNIQQNDELNQFRDDEIDITGTIDTNNINLDEPIIITISSDYESYNMEPLATDNLVQETPTKNKVTSEISNNSPKTINKDAIAVYREGENYERPHNTKNKHDKEDTESRKYNQRELDENTKGLKENFIKKGDTEEIDTRDKTKEKTPPNIPSCSKSYIPSPSKRTHESNKEKSHPEINTEKSPAKTIIVPEQKTPENDFTTHEPRTNQDIINLPSSQVTLNVPTPFKKALFWHEPKPSTSKKQREKVPAVVTSQLWQNYYRRKEEKKNEELLEKENRILVRKRNQADKEEKTKNKKIKRKESKLSLPSEEVDNEPKNEKNKEINIDSFSLGEFVIVSYIDQHYPGEIIGIHYDKNEEQFKYQVNHMEKKGLNWIWPEKKDIFSYTKEEIIKKIQKPEAKNKRGLHIIEELSNFSI